MKITKDRNDTIDLEALIESDRHILCDALLCLHYTAARAAESLPKGTDDEQTTHLAVYLEAITARGDELRAAMISAAERQTGDFVEV